MPKEYKNPKNRSRYISVTFRMNEEEYAALRERIASSGMQSQSFLLETVLTAQSPSKEYLDALDGIRNELKAIRVQIAGACRNIKQISKTVNKYEAISNADWKYLQKKLIELQDYREEIREKWQSLKTLMAGRKKAENTKTPTTKPNEP